MRAFHDFAVFAALALCGVASAPAYATCDSVASCTLSDFRTAAAGTGCDLLFITARRANCTAAGASLHSGASCGPIGTNPPACTAANADRAVVRWRQCAQDRTAQQAAFASGLNDVAAARRVDWGNNSRQIRGFLDTIEAAITAGQSGHATQLQGVQTTLRACEALIGHH